MRENRLAVIILFFLIIYLSSCSVNDAHSKENQDIVFDRDYTYFSDYYITDGTVEFVCHYVIINQTNSVCTVQLIGSFEEDHARGLIKEEQLLAEDLEEGNTTFELLPGTNSLDVVYIGTFSGTTNMKASRLLPKTEIRIQAWNG